MSDEVVYKTGESDPTGRAAHEPGAKLDAGKPKLRLILHQMPRAMKLVAFVGEYGAKKYSEKGWMEVPDGINRYTDAMLRHAVDESINPIDESGLLHAAQVAWNALARLELMARGFEEKKDLWEKDRERKATTSKENAPKT